MVLKEDALGVHGVYTWCSGGVYSVLRGYTHCSGGVHSVLRESILDVYIHARQYILAAQGVYTSVLKGPTFNAEGRKTFGADLYLLQNSLEVAHLTVGDHGNGGASLASTACSTTPTHTASNHQQTMDPYCCDTCTHAGPTT